MKTFGTRVYIWLLLIHTFLTDTPESYNIFDNMTDLQELCPHSSFCGRNASSEISLPYNYSPCCRSCSCDKNCGLERNCCFQHLDKYKEKDKTICVSAVLEDKVIRNAPHFRMINECLNTSTKSVQTEHFCGHNSSLFQPVLSQDTGFIYYNEHCARCNEVERTVPWEIAFSCSPDTLDYLPEFIDEFINSNTSKGNPGCFAYYTPPPNTNVASQTCEPNVIRKCNVTGKMRERVPFWDFCEKFNATFMQLQTGFVYGNVYCYFCNLNLVNVLTDFVIDPMCPDTYGYTHDRIQADFRLTVVISTSSFPQNQVSKREEDVNSCPENNVLVPSFQKACRPLKCPWGQFRCNDRCGYCSNKWVGGPFSVMFRLNPVKGDNLIPISFFKEMSEEHKQDKNAAWLERKMMTRWNFKVLYHISTKDFDFVDFIVVKATLPSYSVNPKHLQLTVKRALGDIWMLQYGNVSTALNVSLNDHFFYDFVTYVGFVNATFERGFCPHIMTCFGLDVYNQYCSNELLIPVLEMTEIELNSGVFVTKLYFCNQVELLPEEYNLRCLTVNFKVKNKTIYTFSKVAVQTNKEVDFGTPSDEIRVRVCVDEFDLIAGVDSVNSLTYAALIVLIFIEFSRYIL